jgi:putative hemolysin
MEIHLSEIILLIIFFIFSAFFSGTETALFSLKRSELFKYSTSDDFIERSIHKSMQNPQNILLTILIGNIFANISISVITTKILISKWQDYGQFLSIVIVTPIVILLCEITPKILAISSYSSASKILYPLLTLVHKIFFPLRILLSGVMTFIIKIFNLKLTDINITEDEIGLAVKIGEQEGHIHKEESAFIKSMLRFSKKEAYNIMLPRNTALFIPWGCSVKEAINLMLEYDAVRAPVYKEDIDNVIGMIDSRELLPSFLGYKKISSINRFVEKIHFFPASKDLKDLLNDFLKLRIQIGIAVDEYGGTAGVVTLNSILSDLMGREFHGLDSPKKSEVRKIEDTTMISGNMQIDDFNILFGENIISANSDTISGYMIEVLSSMPKTGNSVITASHILLIKKIRKHTIDKIEVKEYNISEYGDNA